jgi:hypothetical protein
MPSHVSIQLWQFPTMPQHIMNGIKCHDPS